jgi:hypothetical protein
MKIANQAADLGLLVHPRCCHARVQNIHPEHGIGLFVHDLKCENFEIYGQNKNPWLQLAK